MTARLYLTVPVFLLDPDSLVLRIRSTRVAAPVSPVLVLLVLGLAGGAIYLWVRRDRPDE